MVTASHQWRASMPTIGERVIDPIGLYVRPEADVPRPTRLPVRARQRLLDHAHVWWYWPSRVLQCTSCGAVGTFRSAGEAIANPQDLPAGKGRPNAAER